MKNKIKIGDTVIMPDPKSDGSDSWQIGGFSARVTDILENDELIVEDQDSDFFTIEPDRVEIQA